MICCYLIPLPLSLCNLFTIRKGESGLKYSATCAKMTYLALVIRRVKLNELCHLLFCCQAAKSFELAFLLWETVNTTLVQSSRLPPGLIYGTSSTSLVLAWLLCEEQVL